MTKLSAGWPATGTKLSAGFTETLTKNLQPVLGSTAQSYSAMPSNGCPFRCLTCWLRRMVLYSSWVLSRCSSCNRLHSLFAWAKSCFSKEILSYNNVFFSPPDGIQRTSVRFAGVPSWKYRCVASVLFLTCLFDHLFCLVVHSLSFRRSVFHSTTAVLINHISRDWGNVAVVLIDLCWTPRRFHISSTAAIDKTNFPIRIVVRTLLFGEFSQSATISVLFKSAIKSCDSLLNLLIGCVWLKSWKNDFLCLWFWNFSINFLTLFSSFVSCCSTAESIPDVLWSTVLLQVSP